MSGVTYGVADGGYQDDYYFEYEEEEDSGSEYIIDNEMQYEEAFGEEVVELSDGDLGSESEYEEEIIEDYEDDVEYEYEEDFGEEDDFEEVSFDDSPDESDFVPQKNFILDKSHHLMLGEADAVSYGLTVDEGDFDSIDDSLEFEEDEKDLAALMAIVNQKKLPGIDPVPQQGTEITAKAAPRGSMRQKRRSQGSKAMKKSKKPDMVAAVSSKVNDRQKRMSQRDHHQAIPVEVNKGPDMAALLAAKANDRQKRMSQGLQKVTDVKPRPVQRGDWAAMIAAKASDRQKRLDKGGERKITPVKPKPNQGLDMAAMVALKAQERNKRLMQAEQQRAAEAKQKPDQNKDMAAMSIAKTSKQEQKRTQTEQQQTLHSKPKTSQGQGKGTAAVVPAQPNERPGKIVDGGQTKRPSLAKPAGVAGKADNRHRRSSQGKGTEVKPRPVQRVDMAAMIAAKANDRQKRLAKGGERKITPVKPKPNQGMDMAAMVASKAKARNQRIEAGGKVKVRKVPQEHKTTFVNIATEAARVGTLTKLSEHTVEAIGASKEVEEWEGPTGLRTDHLRSDMFIAINEAAALGAMRKLKPVEVTNYDQHAPSLEEEPEDVDKMTDKHGRRVVRQLYLIDRQLAEDRKHKHENWSAENAANIVQYKNWEDVVLPAERAPRLGRRDSKKTRGDIMEAIAHGVAEKAWERNYRLGRPKADLRITQKCMCKFCVNANPFQTHKFRQLEKGVPLSSGPIVVAQKVPKKKKTKRISKRKSKRISDAGARSPGSEPQQNGKRPEPTKTKRRRRKPESIFIPNIDPSATELKQPPILLSSSRGLSLYEYRYEHADEQMPAPEHWSVSTPGAPLLYSPPKPAAGTISSAERRIYSGYKGEPGAMVLLDETTTWSYKRKTPRKATTRGEGTRRGKPARRTPRPQENSNGCSIM